MPYGKTPARGLPVMKTKAKNNKKKIAKKASRKKKAVRKIAPTPTFRSVMGDY